MKILVVHGSYGCETGCCGHFLEAENDDGSEGHLPDRVDGGINNFVFEHPYFEDRGKEREWAEELLRDRFGDEHVKDLDWDNCIVSDD